MNEASCSDFIYNPVDKECIVATNYYPEGFEIVKKGSDLQNQLWI